ncbi:hypothetical protein Tco_1143637 [Tanacetum coccineum]
MAAGSKDRPPMLGPGRYSQWRSRFLWYIDTKNNGEGLRKCILNGPYVPQVYLFTEFQKRRCPAVQQHTAIENGIEHDPVNKEHFLLKKEASYLAFNCLEGYDMQKNLALLAKYFKRLYKPTNNNLRTSSNSRNKTEDTTPRCSTTDEQAELASGHGWKRMMNQDWKHLQYRQRFKEVSPEDPVLLCQPIERYKNHDESNVYDNVRQHSEQPESINDTYVLEKDVSLNY